MPRPIRLNGRPGTRVIPADWGVSHAPAAAGGSTAVVTLRHPGGTTVWQNNQDVSVPLDPYAVDQPARIQAERPLSLRGSTETAGETIRVSGYLVALPYELEPRIGDLIDVVSSDDPVLTGRTLLVVDLVLGSLRFERDVLATLND